MEEELEKIRQLLLADEKNAKVALQLLKNRPDLKEQLEQEFAPVLEALQKKRLSSLTTLVRKFRNQERLNKKERLAVIAHPEWAKGITALDLADQRLDTFIDIPAHLSHLEVLNLNINKIKVFPKQLKHLGNLKKLYLNNNHLTSFPEVLVGLQQLRELHLGTNKISTIPASIGQLQSLRLLDLASNKLRSLPDSITSLDQLTDLRLHMNQLKQLPTTIGNLAALEFLDLASWKNQLTHLPDSFAALKQLKRLSLTSAKPWRYLEPLFECTQLESLNLGLAEATPLPPQISQLQQLRSLEIYGSRSTLERLPDQIGSLTKLTRLFIYDTHHLKHIPDSIQQLSQLKSLQIVGHSIPKSQQKHIEALLPHSFVRF